MYVMLFDFLIYPVSASFIAQRKREEIIALPCIRLFSYQTSAPKTDLYVYSCIPEPTKQGVLQSRNDSTCVLLFGNSGSLPNGPLSCDVELWLHIFDPWPFPSRHGHYSGYSSFLYLQATTHSIQECAGTITNWNRHRRRWFVPSRMILQPEARIGHLIDTSPCLEAIDCSYSTHEV